MKQQPQQQAQLQQPESWPVEETGIVKRRKLSNLVKSKRSPTDEEEDEMITQCNRPVKQVNRKRSSKKTADHDETMSEKDSDEYDGDENLTSSPVKRSKKFNAKEQKFQHTDSDNNDFNESDGKPKKARKTYKREQQQQLQQYQQQNESFSGDKTSRKKRSDGIPAQTSFASVQQSNKQPKQEKTMAAPTIATVVPIPVKPETRRIVFAKTNTEIIPDFELVDVRVHEREINNENMNNGKNNNRRPPATNVLLLALRALKQQSCVPQDMVVFHGNVHLKPNALNNVCVHVYGTIKVQLIYGTSLIDAKNGGLSVVLHNTNNDYCEVQVGDVIGYLELRSLNDKLKLSI